MPHLCMFTVGEQSLALPIGQVQQVVEHADCTPVPLSGKAVVGLVNLRGRVVTSVDARVCLGLALDGEVPSTHLVVFVGGRLLSLRVDDVSGVKEVSDAELRPVPPNLPSQRRALATGVVVTENTLTLLLDAARIARTLIDRNKKEVAA